MNINKITGILFLTLILIFFSSAVVNADSPKAQLKQYVSDLQNDPSNQELREKIIKLAKKVKPTIPEEARQHAVKAGVMFKAAMEKNGYELAIGEFNQALLLAPWWGTTYYNLAQALEADEQFEEAENTLKLYLLTGPKSKDAREAQDKIYAIDAKKEVAAHKDDWIKNMEGRRYMGQQIHCGAWFVIDVKNNNLVQAVFNPNRISDCAGDGAELFEMHKWPITGHQIIDSYWTISISEDCENITVHVNNESKHFPDQVYHWQK